MIIFIAKTMILIAKMQYHFIVAILFILAIKNMIVFGNQKQHLV